MEKLGPRKHRYTLAILSWLYAISGILGLLQIGIEMGLEHKFPLWFFSVTLWNIVVATFGLMALSKEKESVMKVFGAKLIFMLLLHTIGMVFLIFVIFNRQTLIDEYLTELMNSYSNSEESSNVMDSIQIYFKCCGRKSVDDWMSMSTSIPPASCCKDCSNPWHKIFYDRGCIAILTSFGAYILTAYTLLCVLFFIFHVFAIKFAFELATIYERALTEPLLKAGYDNLINE